MKFESPDIYGISLSGLLLFKAIAPYLRYISPVNPEIVKILAPEWAQRLYEQLIYRTAIRERSCSSSWTLMRVLLCLCFVGANICCVLVNSSSLADAAARCGELALCNMLLLYTGPSLSFVAHLLHIRLYSLYHIHSLAGVVVVLLTAFHSAAGAISKGDFPLNEGSNLWAFIAVVCTCLLGFPITFFSKIIPYELLNVLHHLISAAVVYFTWRHLPSHGTRSRLYMLVLGIIHLSVLLLQSSLMLSRNRFWFSQARLSKQPAEPERLGLIHAVVHLRKPLIAEPGQYINLWMVASPGSVVQSHPFAIVSWTEEPQSQFELYIVPREGFTKRLLANLEFGNTTLACAFTGPHGRALPDTSEHTLVFAEDVGIFSVLALLRKLVHFHHTFRMCARRVHLVWQITDKDVAGEARRFVNNTLLYDKGKDDKGDDDKGADDEDKDDKDKDEEPRVCRRCRGKHEPIFRVTIYKDLKLSASHDNKVGDKNLPPHGDTSGNTGSAKAENALVSIPKAGPRDMLGTTGSGKRTQRIPTDLSLDLSTTGQRVTYQNGRVDFLPVVEDELHISRIIGPGRGRPLLRSSTAAEPLMIAACVGRKGREELLLAARKHAPEVALKFAEFEP